MSETDRNIPVLSPEEREYYKIIDRCAVLSLNKKISNARPHHARYLIDKLFSLSEKTVRIYSGELLAEMYDELLDAEVKIYGDPGVIEAAVEATKRDVQIRITVEEENVDLSKHPLVTAVRDRGEPKNLFFGWIGKRGLHLLKTNGINRHMVVMDEQAYRLELDGHPGVEAEANFGDAPFASTLARTFDLATKQADFTVG